MNIICGINNFRLIDFSNYPTTLIKEKDYKLIKPYELLGRERETNNNLISVEFTQYKEGCKKVVDNTTGIVDIKMNNLKINFHN